MSAGPPLHGGGGAPLFPLGVQPGRAAWPSPARKAEGVTTRLSHADRSRRTRRTLLDAERAVFADMDYVHATIPALVRRTGVTRGALLYRFHDKFEFFEAVFTVQVTTLGAEFLRDMAGEC